jgi:hypothetical protein
MRHYFNRWRNENEHNVVMLRLKIRSFAATIEKTIKNNKQRGFGNM